MARRERRLSPWTTLIEKDVEFAAGRAPDTYHAFGGVDWVTAVARTPDGRIAVVRQYRPAVEQYTWELPSGLVDPGEDPETACRRELREETGLQAERLTYLGGLRPDVGTPRAHRAHLPGRGVWPAPGLRAGARRDGGVRLLPARIVDLIRDGSSARLHHIAAWFLADGGGPSRG